MIKSTPIDAPDRKSLELAKEAMDDVNSYVNEMKRDNETRQLIIEVQNSITELTMVSIWFLSVVGFLLQWGNSSVPKKKQCSHKYTRNWN